MKKTFISLLLGLLAAYRAPAQNDFYVPCNGLAYILQDLGPTNVNSCVGSSPSVTIQIHPAWDEVVHPFGPSNTLITLEHFVYWRVNGTNIPGAMQLITPNPPDPTNITLTLTSAAALQSGLYDVIISNHCNVVTSRTAQVSIGPVVLVPPQSVTGQVSQAVSLSAV